MTNRLARETSPYLLQHAENPVDWFPWGDEAFERARELDRPILLSIGYSACHWCHVMERESFENATTAALMNELFVAIKVDREERPDVDSLYMTSVVSLSGHGGWPMTVFLLPDGRPYYGGTYFPPEPRQGMPSFPQVLTGVAGAFREQREMVTEQAERITEVLRQGRLGSDREPDWAPTEATLVDALVALRGQHDERAGGFGRAPKFPPHGVLTFLLTMHRRRGSATALEMATHTLDRMAAGGIFDQLGGGFHRYSVDAVWLVPHFEKMLYDNALLARSYTGAFQLTNEARYRQTAEATLDYIQRELVLEHGGVASAQDADTDGVEGLTFTWTPEQLRDVLEPHEAALVERIYGVTQAGNFEGASILSLVETPTDLEEVRLVGVRKRLLAARATRAQPQRDDKALAAWNGMALAAFAEAARVYGRADYLATAERCAAFLLGQLSRADGRLLRTHRAGKSQIDAFLDDYAQVAAGLFELHLATRDPRYLGEARRLALVACERFATESGGFADTADDAETLIARPQELDDNPTPSGNSTLAGVLVRLARVYGEPELERRAGQVVAAVNTLLTRAPQGFGHLLAVTAALLDPPQQVAIVGHATPELAAAALAGWDPFLAACFGDGADDRGVELLRGRGLVDGQPAVYRCSGFTCAAPSTTPEGARAR